MNTTNFQNSLNELVSWSLSEFSHLPWRKERSLYRTLVSEIMLQQTTVSTVLNHFDDFMKEYPTPFSVAEASEEDLLISWKGLGYYRRARNLQKACRVICSEYNGEVPLDFDQLVAISGIGVYTANAIKAMGANKKALAVDANLERILSRLYGIYELKGLKLQKKILQLFNDNEICHEIESVGARAYNEALMDLGRNYCQARKTNCSFCFFKRSCHAFQSDAVENLPKTIDKKRESFSLELLRVVLKEDGKYLVYKKKENEWLSNQYEVPTFTISSEDTSFSQYPKIRGNFEFLPSVNTFITKYKISNKVIWVNRKEALELGIKISDYEFSSKNLSTASVKSIEL